MKTRKKLLAVLCGIVVFLNLSINFFAVFSLGWIGSETQEIAGEFEKIAELMQDKNAVSQLALSRLGQSTAMSSSAVRLRQELQERTLSGSRGKVEAAAKEYLDSLITLAGNMAEKLSSRSIVLSLSYDYVYLNPQNAKKNLQSARRIVGELQAESERAGQRNTYMGYLKGKSSTMLYEQFGELKYKYRNREFWCKGYYVDTVGKNETRIAEYIKSNSRKINSANN